MKPSEPVRLYNCTTEAEQATWAVDHLRKGGRIHDIGLWLGGVDRPMRILALAKIALRSEGHCLVAGMKPLQDAAGAIHDVLAWRLVPSQSH